VPIRAQLVQTARPPIAIRRVSLTTYAVPDNPTDPGAAALDLIVQRPLSMAARIAAAAEGGGLTEALQGCGMLHVEVAFAGLSWPRNLDGSPTDSGAGPRSAAETKTPGLRPGCHYLLPVRSCMRPTVMAGTLSVAASSGLVAMRQTLTAAASSGPGAAWPIDPDRLHFS
jgi:hypothetical protein